jgi:hypothetical protein
MFAVPQVGMTPSIETSMTAFGAVVVPENWASESWATWYGLGWS